jgi:hypothetical protein
MAQIGAVSRLPQRSQLCTSASTVANACNSGCNSVSRFLIRCNAMRRALR